MSTKTTIKRIALVAAVAAAFGGLSTVAANAATNAAQSGMGAQPNVVNSTTYAAGGSTETTTVTAAPVVGTYQPIDIAAGTSDSYYTITTSGVGALAFPAAASVQLLTNLGNGAELWTNGTVPGAGSAFTTSTTNGDLLFSAFSATAGTETITIKGNVSGTITDTLTWGAAAVTSAQYSQIVMIAGSTAPQATGSAPVALSGTNVSNVNATSTAGTADAVIAVVTNSSSTNTLLTDKITATITGPGTLGSSFSNTAATTSTGTSFSVTETGGFANFTVFATGVSGVGTITLVDATAGVTLGSRTVTFTGSPAKATATQGLYVLKAGGATPGTGAGAAQSATADAATSVATTSAVTATLVDANGVGVNGTVKIVSSNSAVAVAVGCTQVTLSAGTYQCDVQGATGALSGQSATITFEAQDSTGAYTILATPLTFTIGGAVSTETLSTDATAYAALAPVKLTVTATDSAGNAAYDQDATLVASLVSSTQLGGTLASPTKLVNGVGSVTGLYAPTVAGTVTVSGTDNLSTASEAVTTSFASNGGSADAASAAATDAANEATDAANAATDAANAAADAADAATSAAQDASAQAQAALAAVNALSAKITVLAAQIAKIVKKLKA